MKILTLILVLIMIKMIFLSSSFCDASKMGSQSKNECHNAKTGDGYCCFMEAPKSNPTSQCVPLSKYQYEHIDVLVDFYKTFGGDNGDTEDKDLKIDCKSFYLEISSFLLILLLF